MSGVNSGSGRLNFARAIAAGRALVLVITVVAAAGCERPAPKNCGPSDRQCAARAMNEHAVRKIAFWRRALALPLDQRIGVAPPELIEYLGLDNIAHGYPNRPKAAQVAPDFLRDFQDAVAELPEPFKRRLAGKLAGIYFMQDFGGSGYTESVWDTHGNQVARFTVFDPGALDKTANAWATWKENTPFKPQAAYRLSAEIEDARHDNRKNAIQYILLHEMAHVMAIGEKIHPEWGISAKSVLAPESYGYFSLSWVASREINRFESIFDADFPQRKEVVYYFGAMLPADRMAEMYEHLERTNFPTLYATNNYADDFAEAMANYVHVVMLNKPFRITITRDGGAVKVYESCWSQARCREKRKILEQFLAAS
jgi:hypothetical protein